MDRERFEAACRAVSEEGREARGIGTLGEKTLHAVLKRYIEPDVSKHEIKIGGFYADIADSGRITEIQTGSFYPLCKKLDQMLVSYKVTVVHPIAVNRYICWLDPSGGALVSRRKSPRKGRIYDVLRQLYYIRDMLCDPGLSIKLVLIDLEEYRLLDGYGESRKGRATKYEKIPVSLLDEIDFTDRRDYMMLLPPSLPDLFTAKELASCLGVSSFVSYLAIKVFLETGCIAPAGKIGRSAAYRICDN